MNDVEKADLFFDGACEPKNPGGWATYGWIVCNAAGGVKMTGKGVAVKPGPGSTNNVAEYSALIAGLEWLDAQGWHGALEMFGDSKLVVEQVNETWACNKEHLQTLRSRVWTLLDKLASLWTIAWIPREQNEAADTLSRLAFEEATGQKFPERRRK